ncbi:helix-turn-helix domain-containing protein [Lachnospiraceae bacterium WCA-9-b2]|jgi:Predicted transcriptional regulators|uniref:Helix-turn-helix domain-containing protein n=1 Tax=Sporofaciens musculi TaxID=2681861 RepID=A0A7X3MGP6_9FIRM|nr:helix-turn-helix transcriptional regulator [Sporofaciens musculi]MCI9422972.1 helix-turn-helix transcriptional regulator [Dorea sp.]MXP76054.1 helix-turn-helix domain-containing protein [Sporofaciens musculi]
MKSIYTDDYINIISVLRAIRINKNITQAEMANLLNVTQSFISKVENRERRLDVVELLSWIDALGVSVSDILPEKYLGGNS